MIPLIIFATTFLTYAYCTSNGAYGGDSGDLLASVYVDGVAHPSGYPLYLLLGKLFTSVIPDFKNFAWQLGLMSALFSSLTVVFYYQTVMRLTGQKAVATVSAFTLAFCYPFWLYAVTVEVFSLHTFLISVIVYFLVRLAETKNNIYLYIVALCIGLSLSNNQTMLLILPGVCISLLLIVGPSLLRPKVLLSSTVFFMLGILPYLYIPFAASKFPPVNWGFAVNLDNFIALITRRAYGWSSFKEGIDTVGILNTLKGSLSYWLTYVGIPLIIPFSIGIFSNYKAVGKWFRIFVWISFLLFGPFFIIYANTPPQNFLSLAIFEKFYLSGLYILMLVFPAGLIWTCRRLLQFSSKLNVPINLAIVVPTVFSLAALGSFGQNITRLNLSDVYVGDTFAKDILDPLPTGSTLLLMSDTHAFNAIYLQQVENYRKDVHIPGLYDGFDKILRGSGIEEQNLIHEKVKNKGTISNEQIGLAISHLAANENLFSDQKLEIVDNYYGKITSIPWGLVYKIEVDRGRNYTKEEYVTTMNEIFSKMRLSEIYRNENVLNYSLTYADAQKIYSIAHERIANYIMEKYNDKETAVVFLKKAIELDPLKKDTAS